MLRTLIAALLAAAVLYCAPVPASAASKRDTKVELDLRPVEMHCVEDDEDEVKELSVYLVNRYLDEVMYYVWFKNGVVVEAGLRLKKKTEERPTWLHLAKRGLLGFSAKDEKFIKNILKDAEPLVQAGCRVPKLQRLEHAHKLKINLPRTQGEAVPDPDVE